jgi:cell division protein FtsA
VRDVVLEPLASAEAVISPEEKELGILLIDLGGGTTDVALFRDGAVWYTGSLPLGGDHISNDIAVGLRTPTAEAEELKKRHGCALTALVREDEVIEVPSVGGRKARQLSRQILSEIIQPRVEEIFTLVARDVGRAGLDGVAAAGVVVTGGSAIMHGVPELAEQVFDVPVRRGAPAGLSGLADVVESPIHSTAVGLALYGARGLGAGAPQDGAEGAGGGRLGRRLREWFAELF